MSLVSHIFFNLYIFARNTISPTFSTSKLKDMFEIIEKCTDKMTDRLLNAIKESNGRFDSKR